MKIQYHSENGAVIVYDADRLGHAASALFDPQYWEARAALVGQAAGRGTTWFVQHDAEQWALRHYCRGGLVAKFVRDHYLWLGLARTRAWREWQLTARLHGQGLPVPAPVAARVIREGLAYRADIITVRIPDVSPLSQRLRSASLPESGWHRLGVALRRFHDAGLDHADLNAHNILLTSASQPYLIDFDKARLRAPGSWREANLERLRRSLRKLQGLSADFHWSEADWDSLRRGYAGGNSL